MIFNGTNLAQSFIDSGSNGIYFTEQYFAVHRSRVSIGFLLSRKQSDVAVDHPRREWRDDE